MKAMILAAGRGERMRPLTDRIPKPLLEAGGKPLIVWHIERLVKAGITELVINHAHLGAQIEQRLGDGSRFGAHIQYSAEGSALETAGGIAYALPLLGDAPFTVVNGDIYCDYDFSLLHERANALHAGGDMAHLVLVDNPVHHPQGDFLLQGNRITPDKAQSSILDPRSFTQQLGVQPLSCAGKTLAVPLLTFSGIGLYHPSLFSHIPRGSVAPLAPLLRAQITQRKISGEYHAGVWVDVGTPQRLAELDAQLSRRCIPELTNLHKATHV